MNIIEHNNQPVLTTSLLAEKFGCSNKNLHDNFSRNKDRFIEGKHYHRLSGGNLKDFKMQPAHSGVVDSKSSHVILWTERGVARHAKILDTDMAWEIFEMLEDTYFKVKEICPQAQVKINSQIENSMIALDYSAKILGWSETSKLRALHTVCEDHGLPTRFLPKYSTERFKKSLGELLKDHGSDMSSRAANLILMDMGYLEELTRRSGKGTIKKFKSLTAKAKSFGVNETSPQNPNQTQPRYYVDTFNDLLDQINEWVINSSEEAG